MAGRSGLSSNWRVRSDVLPQVDNPTAERPGRQRRWGPERDATFNSGDRQGQNKEAESRKMRGEDDPRTLQAIAEGRRLYVGNMPYMAKMRDVEALFADVSYKVEHINMSTDPFTGRNPSYCFVELETKGQADKAMLELNGTDLLGRPVKIGPGVAKGKGKRVNERDASSFSKRQGPSTPVFDRWTRTDAPDHWKEYDMENRRLIVSGLPRMHDHCSVNEGVRELFNGFTINAVSKVIVPSKGDLTSPQPHNNRYLFVDFETAEEAKRAVEATDGRFAWDVQIRVDHARSLGSRKVGERAEWEAEQKPNEQ